MKEAEAALLYERCRGCSAKALNLKRTSATCLGGLSWLLEVRQDGKTASRHSIFCELLLTVSQGNNGLGAASVQALSKHNARIFLAARTVSKGEAAIADIKKAVPNANITLLELDLASFGSIAKAVKTFNAASDRLDVLMNNAGVMGPPPGLTTEGYEIQFGTNHVGHALLTKLLLPTLERTVEKPDADVRIVNLSSEGHRMVPKGGLVLEEDTSTMDQYSPWTRYGQSKLANILFTRELAKRYPKIKSMAVHPGGVSTGLATSYISANSWWATPAYWLIERFLRTSEQGALTQLWAATSPEVKTGAYYVPVAKESGGSGYARDDKLASDLWAWTEKELAKHGY